MYVYYSTVGVQCTHRHACVHTVAALVTIAIQPSTDHDCISAIHMYACNCIMRREQIGSISVTMMWLGLSGTLLCDPVFLDLDVLDGLSVECVRDVYPLIGCLQDAGVAVLRAISSLEVSVVRPCLATVL